MSDQPEEFNKEMPPRQGPEAAAREKYPAGNLVAMYQAQGASTESFPVLQAFQEYIEAERKQSRKRIVQLSVSFAVIIGVVVIGFLAAGVYMMQDTTKRLFQMAEKNSAPPPAPAPALLQGQMAPVQSSPALEESIRQMSMVLAKMQSDNLRPSAAAAEPLAPNAAASRNSELEALKADLVAMKEQSRKLEGALTSLRSQEGAPEQAAAVVKPQPRYSVEDALEIARKTGAAKVAADKAAAEKIAKAREDADKAEAEKIAKAREAAESERLAQVELAKRTALEISAVSARAERDAQARRGPAPQPVPEKTAVVAAERQPADGFPVADKLPPVTPPGVAVPAPPKEMLIVSVPLQTKNGGVLPWRVFVPE